MNSLAGQPAPQSRLTKRALDQAEPLAKPYFVWDGELRGFGVRIDPGGARTFAVRYRPKGHGASAPKRFITLGRYGPLTVDEARNRAKEILGAVATGADPAADLALKRAASTFMEIADLFLREHVGPKRKMSTAQDYELLLTTYAIPALGSRKAEAVTRAEVARLHGQIGDRPYQANRLLAVIGSLYTFAERRGLVPENCNPTRKIEKFPEDRRERFLTSDELERLGAAIREGETVGIAWRDDSDKPRSKHLPSSLSDWHFRRGLGRAAGDFGELRRPSRLDRLHSRLSGRSGVASEACSAGWDAWGTVRRGRGRGRTSA